MMATTAERLKDIMHERKLKQIDIVRMAEPFCRQNDLTLSKSDLSQFVSGKVQPGQWKISLLSKALNVNPAWLMGEDVPQELPEEILPASVRKIGDFSSHRIPLLGAAAAGEPIYSEEIDVYVDGPLKADCAIRVQGDSMEPSFIDGDTLYVRYQPDVDHDGQVVVVICGDDACVKHVYRKSYGLLLVSENPKYDPKELRADEFDGNLRILGKVIGYTRIFRE